MSGAPDPVLRRTRTRLTLVTLGLVGALVLLIGAASAFVGLRALDQDVDQALETAGAGAVAQLHGELPNVGGDEGDERAPQASDTFFLILDPTGKVISNPSNVPLAGLPDPGALASAQAGGQDMRTVEPVAGVPIRLLTLPISHDGKVVGWLEAGFEMRLHEQQSRSLVLVIAIVGLLGLAGAAFVALWVVGRALVPIRHAFATERRFVADASHEIRTPAAIIRSSAEVLERENLVSEDGRTIVEGIVAEADRLGRLVEDLLALAASERGSLSVERRPIDATEVARGTVRRAGPLAAEHGIGLVGPAEDAPALAVHGDAERLVQLLLVLLDNAFRHSPPGGLVTVTAERVGRRAQVAVADKGPGVPEAAREQIFEPFARLSGSRPRRSRGGGGSGLGLAIARRLAELHGGTLVVEEAPGGGARFVLELPLG